MCLTAAMPTGANPLTVYSAFKTKEKVDTFDHLKFKAFVLQNMPLESVKATKKSLQHMICSLYLKHKKCIMLRPFSTHWGGGDMLLFRVQGNLKHCWWKYELLWPLH